MKTFEGKQDGRSQSDVWDFCVGSGWISSSYHHPKIITSEPR